MARKRLVVDARMVGAVGHGIGNYVLELAAAFRSRKLPFEIFYLLSRDCPPSSLLRALPHAVSKIPFLHPLEFFSLASEIRSLKADAFHSPSFMSLRSYPCPHLQTVHDLNHLTFGGLYHRLYYRALLLPSLRSASSVMTVSRYSLGEVAAWLNTHGVKREIGLAFNAISTRVAPDPSVIDRLGLRQGEFFFCLSNPKPHKNVQMLLAAHSAARAKGPSLPLVVNLPGKHQEGILRVANLTDAEISALYCGARAFFFPSLYEGFGRSPLEAALCATKPIVSDISPLREALEGVPEAEFLDPTNPELWQKAFLRLTESKRVSVSDQSREWVLRTYSNTQLGDSIEKEYRKVLSALSAQ